MMADERHTDVVVFEQNATGAGVFGEHEIHRLEHAEGAEGDVFEIADGSGYEIEHGGEAVGAEAGFDAEKHRIVICKNSRFSVLSQIKREKLRASCGKDRTFANDLLNI